MRYFEENAAVNAQKSGIYSLRNNVNVNMGMQFYKIQQTFSQRMK